MEKYPLGKLTLLDIQQTLAEDVLPYSTVAYMVVEFKKGRLSCEDNIIYL